MNLKEDRILTNKNGRPDLARYTDSVDYYVAIYQQYLEAVNGASGRDDDAHLAFRRRVHATWRLIAKGVMAVPHVVAMLRSKDADAREDGAAILAEIGRDSHAVEHVLQAPGSETDAAARDSLILALGAFKDRVAIPALADLIRNNDADNALENRRRIAPRTRWAVTLQPG
jgi:hypothetical protein